jgi:hypothetical protein
VLILERNSLAESRAKVSRKLEAVERREAELAARERGVREAAASVASASVNRRDESRRSPLVRRRVRRRI